MKYFLFTAIITCLLFRGYSQSKTEIGLTTEGSWFNPYRAYDHDWATKAGFGTGLGVYASQTVWWRFSADAGLMFHYKQMEQHYSFPKSGSVEDPYTYQYDEGWAKYGLNYLVVPVHLQLRYGKYGFIRGGIEAGWLTNYTFGRKKTEYNWTVGIGNQRHKLKWSVNYIWGFKEVGFANGLHEYEYENGKYRSATCYKNRMFQLSFSYPIWQRK